MALETPAQIAARRAEHLRMWCSVPCPICQAPAEVICRRRPGLELLADLAHAGRIARVVSGWSRGNGRSA